MGMIAKRKELISCVMEVTSSQYSFLAATEMLKAAGRILLTQLTSQPSAKTLSAFSDG